MGAISRGELPAVLARARGRFEQWRRSRRPGERIPERLWVLAVKLARSHGVGGTVRALGLDFYSLKKRLAAADGSGEATKRAASEQSATFVELSAPPIACRQCIIELDDGGGTTLRVQLAGYDAADVAALSRRLWSRR